ncbi:MAG TPA: outer membrane beta-barrel domain-containing protein [Myxococcales bacterium]|nr:outer membrane beta-barrel domain-containing protein [Myxococcales bacterium]
MRLSSLCFTACLLAGFATRGAEPDEIAAVQKRPLRQAKRLELWTYGEISIADPYLQRWGGGLRGMYHLREGLSVGLDVSGLSSSRTEDLVIAKRELHARIIESHQQAAFAGMVSIAPLYGKVALPGDALVHFETFLDAGLGGALTETDSGRGLRPMVTAGIGQRLFLGENFALTARVGGELYAERVVVDEQRQTHAMGFWTVQFGLSWYLPGQKEDR